MTSGSPRYGVAGDSELEEVPMKVTDPVCGMEFDINKSVAQVEYRGRTYYFCTDACRKQFESDPARYVGGA